MKKILLPTDFSKNSWNAILYALEFFKKDTCNFYLLHVSSVSNYANGFTPVLSTNENSTADVLAETTIALQQLVTKIKGLPANNKHHFFTLASTGPFIEAIRDKILENDIELIVTGTKGANGIKKIIVGSNTGDIITKVKCHVLVVPEKAIFKTPKEIAFPTDYNLFYQSKILHSITEVAGVFNGCIRIVHVAKRDEELTAYQKENKTYLNDFFAGKRYGFYKVTNKKIEAGVQCFVESRNIDLIIMIAKNLNLFQQILFKPTVEEISYHTEIPFLVLHE